jgi:hypothetical protein
MSDPVTPAVPAPAAAEPVAPAAPAVAESGVIPVAATPPPAPAAIELKLPEGFKMNEKFIPVAQELGLDSAKAQKLADFYIGTLQETQVASDAAWKKQQTDWVSEIKADKEIGGQAFESTKVAVARAFDAFDKDGSIRKEIHALGLGSHPALVRLAVRAAALLKEDSTALPTTATPQGPSEDEVLKARYPTMFKV